MMNPENLPVYRHKDVIIDALRENQVIVVESPTGSGKTTQIPKILFDAGFAVNGMIGVTQPRRIAAVSVSSFIAAQYGSPVPGIVGYKMRFVDETVGETKIVIMTDGILLQEIKTDPYLHLYDVIVIDEAHERSLNIDFILGLVKSILRERKDLKIVISSATINASVFSEYFDECPIVTIDARVYPVTVKYMPPEFLHDFESLKERIEGIVLSIDKSKEPGDVLIFLSGEGQIKACISSLERLGSESLVLLPLYGRLSREEQERVFLDFPESRKVIVATNIAETSVTIDGVMHIVDPGFAKLNFYNPKNFTSALVEVPIAKASCNQRKGRAGRTAPGVCYRLYTEEDYEDRELFTKEEIFRTDLSEVVLRMAELGIRDFERFDFISNPGADKIRGAVEALRLLEAIDGKRELTEIGKLMVRFPIIPRLARMIVASINDYPEVMEEVLIAAAFLNGRAPYLLPQGFEMEARKAHHAFRHKQGDFVSYLKIFRAFDSSNDKEGFCERNYLDYKGMQEISNVKRQLGEILYDMGIPVQSGGGFDRYLCAVSKGLVQFVCKRKGKATYSSLTAYGIKIHPGSVMYRQRPEYIVAGEVMRTSQMYAMSVSPLQRDWLKRISPEIHRIFVGKGAPARKRDEREDADRIRVGRERFDVQIRKKRRVAVLPYEKLKRALQSVDLSSLPDYRGIRGRILLGKYELMSDMNLNRILEAAGKLSLDGKIVERWPGGLRFDYETQSGEIVRHLPRLMRPCRKTGSKNRLGFLTLLTDGEGVYWYGGYKDFTQALEESVSSLESLIDEDMKVLGKKGEAVLNRVYRRLTALLED